MKQKYLWELISAVFNPIFAPTVCVVAFYFLSPYPWRSSEFIYTLSVVVLATVVIPVIVMILLKVFGKIQSLGLHSASERRIPLLVILLMMIVALKMFLISYIDQGLSLALIAITVSLFLTYLSLRFSKISLHAMGVSGIIGLVWILCLKWNIHWGFAAVVIGVITLVYNAVVVARLELKEHTPTQIFLGSVVGFVPVVLMLGMLYQIM